MHQPKRPSGEYSDIPLLQWDGPGAWPRAKRRLTINGIIDFALQFAPGGPLGSSEPIPLLDLGAALIPLPQHDPQPQSPPMEFRPAPVHHSPCRRTGRRQSLKKYKSDVDLYKATDIIINCQSSMDGVRIMRDKDYNTYLMSTKAHPLTMPAHAVLGGFGTGTLEARNRRGCHRLGRHSLPWSLPEGDQTMVSRVPYHELAAWSQALHNNKHHGTCGMEKVPQTVHQVLLDLERARMRLDSIIDFLGPVKSEVSISRKNKYSWDPTISMDFVL